MNGFRKDGAVRFPRAKFTPSVEPAKRVRTKVEKARPMPRPRGKSVTGVTVGGKRYTRFSQIKTKPASRIGTRERTRRGITLAIL